MADTAVRTYDPKQVTIIFGPVILSGYAEGTFVSIAQNGDNFEKSRGADGSVDRINKNANDAAVTVTLKQTSLSNTELSAIAAADKLSNAGKYPLSVIDLSGTSIFFAAQAWVGKEPDPENADTLGTREWRLDTGPASNLIGHNL